MVIYSQIGQRPAGLHGQTMKGQSYTAFIFASSPNVQAGIKVEEANHKRVHFCFMAR
jgi:hypothetical protein